MKTILTFCVISFLLAYNVTAQIQKIYASEDTYVQDGETSNETMGVYSAKQLRVSNSNAKNKFSRITYLKFELPKNLKSIENVILHVPVKIFNKTENMEAKFKLDVYTVNNDDWNENTLTWDEKPELSRQVGSIELMKTEGKTSQWQEIVLNTYSIFKIHSRKDNTVTLALLNTNFNKTSAILPSKEQSQGSTSYLTIK